MGGVGAGVGNVEGWERGAGLGAWGRGLGT